MDIQQKLNKRKFKGYEYYANNKWFTGYSGDIICREDAQKWVCGGYEVCKEIPHEVRELSLWLAGNSRGRSSAVMIWKDSAGFSYNMSLSSGCDLIQKIMTGRCKLDIETGLVTAKFIQVKQGANYFIEEVND